MEDNPNVNEYSPDWISYKETGDLKARERLIESYTGLTKYVASRVRQGLPQFVDSEDLVSYGAFGLMDAIEKFDLSYGYKFETYALTRIRGAIIDGIRSNDWIPRSVRNKQRSISNAVVELEAELGRYPAEEEIASHMGIALSDLHEMRDQIGETNTTALDASTPEDNQFELVDRGTAIDTSIGSQESVDDVRSQLASAAQVLPEREQAVLALYYSQGLTLSEVGQVLGVTESRICQIHTKAVLDLREQLAFSELEPA